MWLSLIRANLTHVDPGPGAMSTMLAMPSVLVNLVSFPNQIPSQVCLNCAESDFILIIMLGCGPECVRDPDCQQGYICQSQRCIVKPDPCDPNPCGPGAECSVTGTGNAICRCQTGLIPNPDTISGCKPECVRDPDCQRGFVCQSQRCVEKPDPCDPSPCGPGAECSVTRSGNAICRCQPGLIPNPDTISGCKPECVVDPDCSRGFVCQSQRCVEKPDPCNPSPCGPGAVCTVNFQGLNFLEIKIKNNRID